MMIKTKHEAIFDGHFMTNSNLHLTQAWYHRWATLAHHQAAIA